MGNTSGEMTFFRLGCERYTSHVHCSDVRIGIYVRTDKMGIFVQSQSPLFVQSQVPT